MKLKTKLNRKVRSVEKYYKENRGALWFAFFAGLTAGAIITQSILQPHKATLEPVKQTIQEVSANEPTIEYYQAEPIRWIRYVGEQRGFSNQDITKAIRIARCESGFNQYAKNPGSTAKGIYQFIDGTWRSNCLKDGNVYNFVDNINCFWKVYKDQGDRPWKSSEKCWSK